MDRSLQPRCSNAVSHSPTSLVGVADGFKKYSFDFQPRKANPYLVMIMDVRAFVTALHQKAVLGTQVKPLAAPTVPLHSLAPSLMYRERALAPVSL